MEESIVISNFPRTEGDGMESLDLGTPTSHRDVTFDLSATTNLLSGLEIAPVRNTERVITLVPQSITPKVISKSSQNIGQSEKKVKFVPYEPYKAAVKPIIPIVKRNKVKVSVPVCQSTIHDSHQHITTNTHERDSVSIEDFEKLKKEKEELEAELQLHSKVNGELKRLLVASIGEDMEARVHFLTEDKVKLSDDIRQYVEKIANDFEQKESLSIEADIWRSKFLASSVVIEELSKWKAALSNRNNELKTCIKNLLGDMNIMYHKHQLTLKHMSVLDKAFDPVGKSSSKVPSNTPSDVLECADSILGVTESLCKRLLGTFTQSRGDEESCLEKCPEKLTPAQLEATEALSKCLGESCTMSDVAREVTAMQVSNLAHRSLNKSFYTCCPHCTGQVYTI